MGAARGRRAMQEVCLFPATTPATSQPRAGGDCLLPREAHREKPEVGSLVFRDRGGNQRRAALSTHGTAGPSPEARRAVTSLTTAVNAEASSADVAVRGVAIEMRTPDDSS